MTDLTDIQILKRVAEIQGYYVELNWEGNPVYEDGKGILCKNDNEFFFYNPLAKTVEGKALCFDLGNEFDIVKVWEEYDCLGFYYTDLTNYLNSLQCSHEKIHEVFRVEDHGEQKAVCLAIIAKEDNKDKDNV